MPKKTTIDDYFIRKWEAEYDKIEYDEDGYKDLIKKVREEVARIGTLSRSTVEEIYDWKSARAKGYVKWMEFGIYEDSFRNVLKSPDEDQKVAILDDLPGVGIPIASTILHFVHPRDFPIVDFRTVEVLQDVGYLDESRSYHHFRDTVAGYGIFRQVIATIAEHHPRWSLRQIDRALFAYHKTKLKPESRECNKSAQRLSRCR